MKKVFLVALVVSLLVGLILSGCTQAAPVPKPSPGPASVPAAKTEQVVLNWVSLTPKTQKFTQNVQKGFIDRVNEAAKGEMVINYRGGPEVIRPEDQGKACQSGAIDIVAIPGSYYESIVPGVIGVMYTRASLEKERKPGGAYDYLVGLHNKAGLYYLGHGGSSGPEYFYTWMNTKVQKPEDFKGLLIGGTAASRPCVAAWGSTYVPVQMGDYYQGMESKLVNGLATCPMTNFVGVGLQAVTKYCIDHPYYKGSTLTIMNLNKWNQLSPKLQKVMMDSIIKSEVDQDAWDLDDKAAATKKIKEGGVEFYKFAPDVAKWYVDAAYNAGWDFEISRFGDISKKLMDLESP